jgi:hypothetical protein
MMQPNRREFLKGVSTAVAASGALGFAGSTVPSSSTDAPARTAGKDGYKYRVAFGAWINDMRNEPLPLENWPAANFDSETINSAIRAFDVQSEAGFNLVDNFGLFATTSYPLDIVGAFGDPDRRRKVQGLIATAKERGLKTLFGLGLFTWGFDEIIRQDPEVRGTDRAGKPHAHAMCGAKEKAWKYIEKIIDCALGEFDFAGVHQESADLGWCHCPECGGKYGGVGYNIRLNIRAADYIKHKWPDKLINVIPINWLSGTGREHFDAEEKKAIIELGNHIDCFMDQGWRGTYIADAERKDFCRQLRCAYGTSGGLWLYHSARVDRTSYFLPYPRRTAHAIRMHFDDGARGCMFYQGPMANPAVEINTAVGGRILGDPARRAQDALFEAVGVYYKPRNSAVHKKLVDVFQRAEDGYFGQWDEKRFREVHKTAPPGEFKVNDELFGFSPDPMTYLLEPYLNADGRGAYKKSLVAILRELPGLASSLDDGGRLKRIERAIGLTISFINTIRACKNERWSVDRSEY